jgi:hypothetical protein
MTIINKPLLSGYLRNSSDGETNLFDLDRYVCITWTEIKQRRRRLMYASGYTLRRQDQT